ncbi:PucR family transcriptional regulator [Pseudonocardia hispaniensis]|uniref:PucR family transcriptional regulator n=1 Tax=Pseudonocardia hispaniensis TaxID=904933 RepID=A0ABW1J703_9PSEU
MSRRGLDPDVAALARRLALRLDPLADKLTRRIRAEIDFYREGAVIGPEELWRNVRHNLGYTLTQLTSAEPADLTPARETGRLRAEAGVPLPEILRAYRITFAFLWTELLAEARGGGPRVMQAMLDTATEVWSLADDYSSAMVDTYRATMADRMVAADRHRSALVEALTTGAITDHGTAWEVAKQLDLPFEGLFVVVVAENTALGTEPLPGAERTLRRHGAASAWRLQPDYAVGVVSHGHRCTLARILDALDDLATARVGVSPEYRSLDTTARAMRFAQVSMETLAEGSRGVRQVDDSPLGELVASSLDTTRRVVQRVLGEILLLAPEERSRLLSTAQAWLDAEGSATAAARILYCHPNTVRLRMRRLEEHLGSNLNNPFTVAELATAMQALRTFPALADGVAPPP